nr:metalloproteinase inhibitor 2-like [Nerophis lumbriciformis]
MSWTVKTLILPLVLLCLWRQTQACTCPPVHPQEAFCKADVVLRAVVGEVKADVKGAAPVMYRIQHIATLKGLEKKFGAIYTAVSSAACGVTLTKDVEYLFMGRVLGDGKLYISLCDFFQPWAALSATQKNLLQRYYMGCDCKIQLCYTIHCGISDPKACWWTDFHPLMMMSKGNQARNFACLKRSDGSCVWQQGAVHQHTVAD